MAAIRCCATPDVAFETECIDCGAIDCPHGDPMHYHHDGCPSCWTAANDAERQQATTTSAHDITAATDNNEREHANRSSYRFAL